MEIFSKSNGFPCMPFLACRDLNKGFVLFTLSTLTSHEIGFENRGDLNSKII